MKKDISHVRGPYKVNYIDDAQRKAILEKLNSKEYLSNAIDRIAFKMSDELAHRTEISSAEL